MASVFQRIVVPQLGLYPVDLLDETRALFRSPARNCDGPAECTVRDYGDRHLGRGDLIVLPEPFDNQESEVVCGNTLLTHGKPIAETEDFAKGRDWHGQQ